MPASGASHRIHASGGIMAFVTTFQTEGNEFTAYNIDFSVGPGARGNLPEDIMLVQAVLRIVHFEVSNPLPPPPGETGIEVDGILSRQTRDFIRNAQVLAKKAGESVLLDGIFDPFRHLEERSTISKTRYVFEVINLLARLRCRDDGIDNYENLPARTDIPSELAGALSTPRRENARKYEETARAF
jgi:hypothetical protein